MKCMIRGFTLIELLVVVTIIIVLLSLMTPALDRAMYSAKLTMCGANLDALGNGVLLYAGEYKRRYPYRKGAADTSLNWNPDLIRLGETHLNGRQRIEEYDEIAIIDPYVNVNVAMNEPLSDSVDLEGSHPDTSVSSNYYLAYSFGYLNHRWMNKIGDRMSWTVPGTTPRLFKFNVLAADRDWANVNGRNVKTSHPDKFGMMYNWVSQDQDLGTLNALGLAAGKLTFSYWQGNNGRGSVDDNAGYDDGSVQRFDDVELFDGTMTPVHIANSAPAAFANVHFYLPAMDGGVDVQ